MNSLQMLLVDLVQMSETPLYSSYVWLGRQLGHQMPMDSFLQLVDDLLTEDVLRLWGVDPRSHDRTELYRVPEGLPARYRSTGHNDGRFDPLGLSLTIGSAAEIDEAPPWQVYFDLEREYFELKCLPDSCDDALREVRSYFPDLMLVTTNRLQGKHWTHVSGRVIVAQQN